jgi:DNA polymerase-3 subunit delta'
MVWESTVGLETQREMFRRALSRGRLAHGFLFLGPRGVGKRLLARTLAQCLFCERHEQTDLEACGDCPSCRQVQAGSHPDLLQVGLPEGKRILPISLFVGDDANRGRSGLCFELSRAPMMASRRIAIIDDADAMNDEAANALLKTLEEPPPGAMLILLAPDAESVLPTIRSRCQPMLFSPLNSEQVVTLLEREGHAREAIQKIVSMAEGSLEAARKLLQPELLGLSEAVEKQLRAAAVNSVHAARDVQAKLEELGTESSLQRENMRWVLRFTIEALRKRLSQSENVHELDRIGEMLDRCFLAELHLSRTMPIPLCLESLFMELGRQSRQPSH